MSSARRRMKIWIASTFASGWEGTADEWWAQHPGVKTINSIAPVFTGLKQDEIIEPAGPRRYTRSGGLATPYRWRDA